VYGVGAFVTPFIPAVSLSLRLGQSIVSVVPSASGPDQSIGSVCQTLTNWCGRGGGCYRARIAAFDRALRSL
jgi:hypothetical protein